MNKNNEQQWFQFSLPTTPLLKCALTDDIVTYLWKRIKAARDENTDVKHQLAGNIEQSLQLTDENDYFFNNALKDVCRQYVEENPKVPSFRNSISNLYISNLVLRDFWVNSQLQNDFNPIHDHTGVISFVIWMKVPTSFKEQHEIQKCKNSANPAASDFQIVYNDITGAQRGYTIPMDPSINGTIILFPSTMLHQVYPFYDCEDERVSISGNLYYNGTIGEKQNGLS
tara:strand:+ start:217 stop:897 length:681 start_codon:yes stop_codon:yes gene_type:complete